MGQTATDKLISPIVGKAVTADFDTDARLDVLEAAGSGIPTSAGLKGRLMAVTVGAEAANVIAVTVNVDDLVGDDASGPVRLLVRLWTDVYAQTAANPGLFPITDNGDGTIEANSMAGFSAVVFLTGASTRIQFNVTDAGGGSNTTIYGTVEVIGGATGVFSARHRFTLTFDAV